MLFVNLLRSLRMEATREAGMAMIDFLIPLASAEFDFLGIDHDNVIAGIGVRCPGGLLLARKRLRDSNGERTEALAGSINDVPVVRGIFGFLLVRAHEGSF